jgi:MFS family permease
MLGIASLTLFLSTPAQTYGFSVFIDPMLAEFGWSRSLISSAYTIATLISAGVVLIGGNLIDRFGHRRVMAATTVVYAIALVSMGSVASPFSLVVAFTLLRGSGSSVLTLTGRTLVSQWFVRRRGRAISVVNLGKMLGMGLLPPVTAVLISHLGWRDAWRLNGLMVAALIPIALLLVYSRPEDLKQFPDGDRPLAEENTAAAAAPVERSWTLREALQTRTMWLLLSLNIVPATITNGLSFHQISILTERGLATTTAATTFAVESAIALPMTLIAGWLIDRHGPRPVLALGQAALLATLLWLNAVESVETAIVFGALRGVTSGVWILATEVAWPTYFGRRHLGSIVGMNFAVSFVGVAIGPLPFGLIYDAFGSYDYAIWGMMILPALTIWAAALAVPPKDRLPRAV